MRHQLNPRTLQRNRPIANKRAATNLRGLHRSNGLQNRDGRNHRRTNLVRTNARKTARTIRQRPREVHRVFRTGREPRASHRTGPHPRPKGAGRARAGTTDTSLKLVSPGPVTSSRPLVQTPQNPPNGGFSVCDMTSLTTNPDATRPPCKQQIANNTACLEKKRQTKKRQTSNDRTKHNRKYQLTRNLTTLQ